MINNPFLTQDDSPKVKQHHFNPTHQEIGSLIDLKDFHYLLSAKGKIIGYSNQCAINIVHEELMKHFYGVLIKADVVFVIFEINPKMSLFNIGKTLDEINQASANKDIDILLDTIVNENINPNEIAYKILASIPNEENKKFFIDVDFDDIVLSKEARHIEYLKNKVQSLELENKKLHERTKRLEESLWVLRR